MSWPFHLKCGCFWKEIAGERKSPELLQTGQDWEVEQLFEVFTEDMSMPSSRKKSTTTVWISLFIPIDPQFIPAGNWERHQQWKDNYIENRSGWIVKHAKRTPWDTVTLSLQVSTPDTADLGCKKAVTVSVEVFPDCLETNDLWFPYMYLLAPEYLPPMCFWRSWWC